MGLDWVPLEKPKRGHEAEFERLFHLVYGGTTSEKRPKGLPKYPSQREREKAAKRFDAITIQPYVTARAPVIGASKVADDWARAQYRRRKIADKTEAQFLKELKGLPVTKLAPRGDGLPWYSHGGAGYDVNYFSFRAQFIVIYCDKIVGKKLLGRCFESCFAPGLADLGRDILAVAERYAAKHGVADVARLRLVKDDFGSPRKNAHILFSAAKWCAWWSRRGHGLYAYW